MQEKHGIPTHIRRQKNTPMCMQSNYLSCKKIINNLLLLPFQTIICLTFSISNLTTRFIIFFLLFVGEGGERRNIGAKEEAITGKVRGGGGVGRSLILSRSLFEYIYVLLPPFQIISHSNNFGESNYFKI